MIVVQAVGGLGNQMFQYSFMQYLRKANDDCALNISDFNRYQYHHGFELTKVFNLSSGITPDRCSFSINNRFYARILRKLKGFNLTTQNEFCEMCGVSFVEQRKFETDICFIGSWQDIRYVNPVKDIILESFVFPKLDSRNNSFMDSLEGKNTVSVHVRRNDYIDHSDFKGICTVDYYKKAYELIIKKVTSPLFIIFSDDIDWCKRELGFMSPCCVDWNTGDDSFRDMQLMSLCKHNIIANSTFSWWGAYLNKYNNKIVICPRKWKTNCENNYLIDTNWFAI